MSSTSSQREKRGLWDQLVDCICRDEYTLEELIGGLRGKFTIDGRRFKRDDLELVNKHGQRLQCSHYKARGLAGRRPCVIYCHCNSGSRRDAEEALYVLLPHGITVMCFDFAGSGLSEGEWVTLGAHEVDDLEPVVEHLRSTGSTSRIGLWGRSMGAVTAMLYARRDPSIAGIVIDSPFSRLTDLMTELVVEQKLPIPRPFMRVALSMMRRSVRKRANFNIDDVAPLDDVNEAFVPALFGHALEDTFVHKHHSERLASAYAGDKNLITFRGDHNSVRPSFFYSSVLIFFHNVLECDEALPAASAVRSGEHGTRSISGLMRQSLPPPPRSIADSRAESQAESLVSIGSRKYPAVNGSGSRQPMEISTSRQGHMRRGSELSTSSDSTARSERVTSPNGEALSSMHASIRVPSHPLPTRPSPSMFRGDDGGSVLEGASVMSGDDPEDDAELQAALLASMADAAPVGAASGSDIGSPISVKNLIQQWPPQTSRGVLPEPPPPPGVRPQDLEAAMVAEAIRLSLGDDPPESAARPSSPLLRQPQPLQSSVQQQQQQQAPDRTPGAAAAVADAAPPAAAALARQPAERADNAAPAASGEPPQPLLRRRSPLRAAPASSGDLRAAHAHAEIQPAIQPATQPAIQPEIQSEIQPAASAFAAAASSSMANVAASEASGSAERLRRSSRSSGSRGSPAGVSEQGSGLLPSPQSSGRLSSRQASLALPSTPATITTDGQVTPKGGSVKGGSPPPPSPTGSNNSGASSSRASSRSAEALKTAVSWLFPSPADGLVAKSSKSKSGGLKRFGSGSVEAERRDTPDRKEAASSGGSNWLFPGPADALPKESSRRLSRTRSGGSDRSGRSAASNGRMPEPPGPLLKPTPSSGRSGAANSSAASAALARAVVDISALGIPRDTGARLPPRSLRSNSAGSSHSQHSPAAVTPADFGMPFKAAHDALHRASADSGSPTAAAAQPQHVGAAPGIEGEMAAEPVSRQPFADHDSAPWTIDEIGTQSSNERGGSHFSIDQIGRQSSNDRAGKSYSIDQIGRQSSNDRTSKQYSIDQIGRQSSNERASKQYSIDQIGRQSSNERASRLYSIDQMGRQSSNERTSKRATIDDTGRQSSSEQPSKRATIDQVGSQSSGESVTKRDPPGTPFKRVQARARARAAAKDPDAEEPVPRSASSSSMQLPMPRGIGGGGGSHGSLRRTRSQGGDPALRTPALAIPPGFANVPTSASVGTGSLASSVGSEASFSALRHASGSISGSGEFSVGEEEADFGGGGGVAGGGSGSMLRPFSPVAARSAQPTSPTAAEAEALSGTTTMWTAFSQVLRRSTTPAGSESGRDSHNSSAPQTPKAGGGEGPFSVSAAVPMPRMPIPPPRGELGAFDKLVSGQLASEAGGGSSRRGSGRAPSSCDVSDSESGGGQQRRPGTRRLSGSLPFSGHDSLTAAERRALQIHELSGSDSDLPPRADGTRTRRKSSLSRIDAAKIDVAKGELSTHSAPNIRRIAELAAAAAGDRIAAFGGLNSSKPPSWGPTGRGVVPPKP